MTYAEIIEQNSNAISNPWWAKHAFHYTDVTNAVNIMKTGYLFSRVNATHYKVMNNDNASQQVINMTYSGATSYVRFYFRPLTPTQYHNEGYKHPNARYCQDSNANVPVPVFFILDLNKLLNTSGTMFSEKSLAGGGESLKSGPEEFSKLNFTQIYKNGYMENVEEEKRFRHAEIVHPGQIEILPYLKAIACRNDIERKTLLNLLRKEGSRLFTLYQKKIIVCDECFEKNGLYIAECEYSGDTATIVFQNTAKKKEYTNAHRNGNSKLELKAHVDFHWDKKTVLLGTQSCEFTIDYDNCTATKFTGLMKPKDATAMYMQVFFEDKQVCYMCWQLAEAAML